MFTALGMHRNREKASGEKKSKAALVFDHLQGLAATFLALFGIQYA